MKGFAGIHEVSEDIMNEVYESEAGVTDTTFGTPINNKGMEECKKYDTHCIVLLDATFPGISDEPYMIMRDPEGNVAGMYVTPVKAAEYKDRDDIVWVSEDFLMFTELMGDVSSMDMLPQYRVSLKEKGIDHCFFEPTVKGDTILKNAAGIDPYTSPLATMVLCFNKE